MDILPNEILIDILTRLSQRYVVTICSTVCKKWNLVIFQSTFYSTIHIHSKQQLIKLIQLANEKKSMIKDDKPIGHYVKQLIFHNKYSPEEDDIKSLLVFPNLQHIDGLSGGYYRAQKYKSLYLQLDQPTDFSYWLFGEQWIKKFNNIKHNLKSLTIFNTNELMNFIPPSPQQQQLEIIRIKSIEIKTETDLKKTIKLLVLPKTSLINLTKLEVDFHYRPKYASMDLFIIDENTFENIHQSCPQLESLSLNSFHMDISDEYNNNNNRIIPAHYLKNIDIMLGTLNDPLCFQYLATKYPHLETLSLYLYAWTKEKSKKRKEMDVSQTIFNMFLQFPLLKKFSYKIPSQFSFELIVDFIQAFEIWPHNQFIKWLQLHPNQLLELEYPFDILMENPFAVFGIDPLGLFINESQEIDENNDNNINEITLLSSQQQLNFLNYLTHLSLPFDNAIHLALTYLIQNKNTTTVSTTLENLKIDEHINDHNKYIYIYDWLNIFPNLATLKLGNVEYIKDNDDDVYDIDNEDDDMCNQYFFKLHQLINQRKQQLDIMNNKENKRSFYKLKCLKISYSQLCFKNGFDELLKKCQQLKNLKLKNIVFINPKYSTNEFRIDLSHLHLKSLSIRNVSYSPDTNYKNVKRIKKLNLHETSPGCKRTIDLEKYTSTTTTTATTTATTERFTLFLKCKYIDELL